MLFRSNVVGSPGSKDRNGGGRSFGGGGRPGFQSKQMARGQNDRPGGFRRRQMANSGDDAPVRPATVTVIDDNGNTKIRNVMAGVTDRVTTEIRSGLMEGEMVVTGIQSAAGERAANRSNFGRQQRQGGFGGPGGFGGGP